jgi:hypothetical protein
MKIKIISHPFHGFIPIECKSLFLDVSTSPDKADDIMREIYSTDMKLFSMVMYGKIQEKKEEKGEEDDERRNMYKLQEETKKMNEKYINFLKSKNCKMYEEMLNYRSLLSKDMMKLVTNKWLSEKEKKLKKRESETIEWKVLTAEVVRKVTYEDELDDVIWNLYPVEEVAIRVVKLLHKTLSDTIVNAWLYTDNQVVLSLRKYNDKKLIVHLQCPKGELLQKSKIFINNFLEYYIQ